MWNVGGVHGSVCLWGHARVCVLCACLECLTPHPVNQRTHGRRVRRKCEGEEEEVQEDEGQKGGIQDQTEVVFFFK